MKKILLFAIAVIFVVMSLVQAAHADDCTASVSSGTYGAPAEILPNVAGNVKTANTPAQGVVRH